MLQLLIGVLLLLLKIICQDVGLMEMKILDISYGFIQIILLYSNVK